MFQRVKQLGQSARTRGGLVTPCDDLVAILEEAEVRFRNEIGKSKLVIRNIPTDKISFLTLESLNHCGITL